MSNPHSPLENLHIASPCHEDWGAMTGDERTRFCHQCQLNVYNLSEMSRKEAEALIAQKEGKLCVRYYLRKDGTVLTQNCPVGLRAVQRRVLRVASVITAAVISFFTTIGVYAASNSDKDNPAPPPCDVSQHPGTATMGEAVAPQVLMGSPIPYPPNYGEIKDPNPPSDGQTSPPETKPVPVMGKYQVQEREQPTPPAPEPTEPLEQK